MSSTDPEQPPVSRPEGQAIKIYDRPERKSMSPAIMVILLIIAIFLIFMAYTFLRHH